MAISVPEGYVYLDWAATAPLCEESFEAMKPLLVPGIAGIALGMNANSLHAPGRAAFEAMEMARRQIAKDIGANRPSEIVFTSGATEADNAAVLGMAHAAAVKRHAASGSRSSLRVVTTAIEHEAVARPFDRLKAEGFEVVRLNPDKAGLVSAESLAEVVNDDTLLVSVQMANSEVGSIMPICQMAAIAHEAGALFHTDATQAAGKVDLDVVALGVDALSLSAHKVGGPKGVGLLYLRARTPFESQMLGGGQEESRRSTTQNVAGIVGFAAALSAAVASREDESRRQRDLRDRLYELMRRLPGVRPTVEVPSGSEDYLPNIVHVLVDGYESETLVLRLDKMGFGVSGGSACSSHSLEPSHVLRAMGVSADDAYGALRVSIGRYTTEDDIDKFAAALAECIGR